MSKTDNSDDSKKDQQKGSGTLIEVSIMTAFSGILFSYLLRIATATPASFSLFDRIILLVALYASCIAICSFIMPVLSIKLRLEKYVKRLDNAMRVGAFAATTSVFLSLGMALSELLNKEIAYVLAALPFIIIGLAVTRK